MSLLYEALAAARWRGISDAEYEAMDVDEQARLIAFYRTSMQIIAVEAHMSRKR